MILLLTLLLCASDCRVHRAEGREFYNCRGISDGMGWSTGCDNPSHWFPCTAVEKCDTVRYITLGNVRGTYDTVGYITNCVAETTLVDTTFIRVDDGSGVIDTIASKHYDSNDPNKLPCPKGYHGVRVGIVVDTDPPTYCYSCVKDTLVDSGVRLAPLPDPDTMLYGYGLRPGRDSTRNIRRPHESRYEIDTSYFLDSAELADIREMLSRWDWVMRRIAYYDCLDTLKLPPDTLCFFGYMDTVSIFMAKPTHYPTVRDSCACLYGGGK